MVRPDIVADDGFDAIYRHGGHDSNNHTGYISAAASEKEASERKKPTLDHWLSPRIVFRSVMEIYPELLDDYDEFRYTFRLAGSTISVTSEQNREVMFRNDGERVIVRELTIEKYDPWRFYNEKTNEVSKGLPMAKELTPPYVTEWEKKYLIRG